MQRKLLIGTLSGVVISIALLTYFLTPDINFSYEEFNHNDYVGIAPTPEPLPQDLKPNEVVLEYSKVQGGDTIQEEWKIREEVHIPKSLITFPIALTLDTPFVAQVAYDLTDGLVAQLQVWKDECDTALADPVYFNDPDNSIPQVNLDGLTEIEWCTGQSGAFEYLITNDGGSVNTGQFNANAFWHEVILIIRDSYIGSSEYTYSVGPHSLTRSDIELTLTEFRQATGEEAIVSIITDLPRYVFSTQVKTTCVGECTQFSIPITSSLMTDMTEGAGDGDGDWHDELDEGAPLSGADDGDTSYWVTGSNPGAYGTFCIHNAYVYNSTTNLSDPTVHTAHNYGTTIQKSASGGRQIDSKVQLCENSDTIRSEVGSTDIGFAWFDLTNTMTTGEASNISNYSNISLATAFETIGGGPGRAGEITAYEWSVPDVAGGRRIFIVD